MPAKQRLLFIAPLPDPITGQSLACQVLLDEIRDRYDVEVVNLSKRTFQQGANSLSRFREIGQALAAVALRARRADVVYFTNSESLAGNMKDLLIYLLCAGRMERMIVHLHGGAGMREIMAGKYPLLPTLNRAAVRRLGAMIVLGPRLRGIYEGLLPPERLVEVANFAVEDLFLEDAAIASKHADPGPMRILFLSNLLPGKGHEELLAAFASLPDDVRMGLQLDFAGGFEGPEDEARFRAALATVPNSHYHGSVRGEQKKRLLADAHLFCLPTWYPYEGQPISILEAYASGAAVLTTDHSGIFDVFTPGVNGLAVAKRSPASIADAIVALARDRERLAEIGRTNAEQARREYRVEHFVARVATVIDAVATR